MKKAFIIVSGVLAALVACGAMLWFHAFEFGPRFTREEILARIPTASARQTLDYYIWGVNHHDLSVIHECIPRRNDDLYKSIGGFEILNIRELRSETRLTGAKRDGMIGDCCTFKVKFRYHALFCRDDPSMQNHSIYDWSFSMAKTKEKKHWVVVGWGY